MSCEKRWATPLAEISCGATTLRFEERGRDTGFPSGAISHTPVLIVNGKVVDDAGWNISPDGYRLLLSNAVRYRSYRVMEAGSYDWHIQPWPIYLPTVDRQQFGAISDCIESNLSTIDKAFDKAIPDRRYRITSTWNVAHDSPLLLLDWKCPDGRFIRLSPPESVSLCDPGGGACPPLGRVTTSGNLLQLDAPAQDFYRQCRNASGQSFFESLQPAQQ